MTIGTREVEPENVRDEFATEMNSVPDSEFVKFFFGLASEKDSFRTGAWDFSAHIASIAMPFLKNTSVCVDIGCGAGRLLPAAGLHFDRVIGLDLHSRHRLVAEMLKQQGGSNILTMPFDGCSWPVRNNSVDLVYCIYVLPYAGSIDAVQGHLLEARRVLRPGGIALFYYGARSTLASDKASIVWKWVDDMRETIPPWTHLQNWKGPVNKKNLLIPRMTFYRLARDAGLSCLKSGRSRRLFSPPRWAGQRYHLLQKSL